MTVKFFFIPEHNYFFIAIYNSLTKIIDYSLLVGLSRLS